MDFKTWFIFGAILACTSAKAVSRRRKNALYQTTKGMNQFAVDLYKKTAKLHKGNLISSPLSTGIALSMAAYGAQGATEYEMKSNLHLPVDDKLGQKGFLSLITALHKIKKVNLKLAQGLFIDHHLNVHREFSNMTKNVFKSPTRRLYFEKPEYTAQYINNWCKRFTKNLIKDIVQPEDIKKGFSILVNAVYFKGSWKSPFKTEHTSLQPFFTNSKTYKYAPMMYQKSRFNYGLLAEGKAVYVELPYDTSNPGHSLSMFVILPIKEEGLEEIEQTLRYIDYRKLHFKGYENNIELYMPKFKIASTIDLQPILDMMGMRRMFRDRADFSGITEKFMKITKAVQKAVIEVDEAGASTGLVGRMTSGGYSSRIVLNRPFIVKIVHTSTNTILLQGHVVDPSK
ncbi:ovalbumin-related protein X-like [Cotesia glomerata]|uniref:ovalbumin-related protein X-like n=1 Tax=Cotesia glomerata TaxID=32391 RepID=UPI001D010487|nr:ovalbumin-related protein X-like [Cotesia glomerata]